MAATDIQSTKQFVSLMAEHRLVVADFHATWCGPCKTIAPIYNQLASQLARPGVIAFARIDVDAQKELASNYNVTAMPTFLILESSREVKRIKGADVNALNAAVKELAAEAAKAGPAQSKGGEASGSAAKSGGDGKDWAAFAPPKGYNDITSVVDVKGLDFLNLDNEAGDQRAPFNDTKPSALGKDAVPAATKDWIESDTDEQLMLFIPFQNTLKLHTIHITSIPPKDSDDVSRPSAIRLYHNRSTTLGFDEADDTPATQTFELRAADWDEATGTAKLDLRFVKFQNVSSIVMFVAESEGDGEKTRIDRLRMFGEAGDKREMGQLKKIGDEPGE